MLKRFVPALIAGSILAAGLLVPHMAQADVTPGPTGSTVPVNVPAPPHFTRPPYAAPRH